MSSELSWATIINEVLKHKICTENDTDLFVDAILLPLINAPGIGTELPKQMDQQIEQISNPEIPDNDQHEFMGLHCKTNHLLFMAMIQLAEHKRITKKFT